MDPIAMLTVVLDLLYIGLLAQAVVMHALGRHQRCRRNMFLVAVLGSLALATATVRADGEMALVLQPLQTISLLSMVLGGFYVLASWLKTANDMAVQNPVYSVYVDTELEGGLGDIRDEYPASSTSGRLYTEVENMEVQTTFQKQQTRYNVSQQPFTASAAEQLLKSLDGVSPSKPHTSMVSEGLGDVPLAKNSDSKVSTTSANTSRHAAVSTESNPSHRLEQSWQERSEGPSLADHEKRIMEMYASEMRILERAAQRRDRKNGGHGGKTQDALSLDTLLNNGDYATIKRLVTQAKKCLRVEGVVVKGKIYTDRIAYLRLQDWLLLYRMRGGPVKKKLPQRQLKRLKSLRLVREEDGAIHPTVRGMAVGQAFWQALKNMSRRARMRQGIADDNN
ncbi:MAG: hypothetical protein QW420_01660 [Candidatus Caldarchaeum sp.]